MDTLYKEDELINLGFRKCNLSSEFYGLDSRKNETGYIKYLKSHSGGNYGLNVIYCYIYEDKLYKVYAYGDNSATMEFITSLHSNPLLNKILLDNL